MWFERYQVVREKEVYGLNDSNRGQGLRGSNLEGVKKVQGLSTMSVLVQSIVERPSNS